VDPTNEIKFIIYAGKIGKNLLFFGCFDRKKDFIYADELGEWQQMGVLDLITAFSHEQEERIFVQHRMKQHSAEIWRLISKENAIVYVCGYVRLNTASVSIY